MTELDNYGRDYLRLALEIGKHVEGYVDAYYGPPEIKAEVEVGEKKSPAALLGDLARLKESIPSGDPARHAYLVAIFRAMDCTLRMQTGEEFGYLDEVSRLYDISPESVDEAIFINAHRELDSLLPGKGSIAERMRDRHEHYAIPAKQILPMLRLARAETRRRTKSFISLVDGEKIDITLVNDRPYGMCNQYLGNGHSLVEFNTDVPLLALTLVQYMAHEAYPGHHTEAQFKDVLLYRGQGYAEHACRLSHSPAALISEGIGETAIDVIFPGDSHHDWISRVLLPAIGLPAEPVGQMRRIAAAEDALRYVDSSAAFLYHTGELNESQAIEYIQTYGLFGEERARRMFDFISHPVSRSYTVTCTQGGDLIRKAARNWDNEVLFLRLLVEPVLPSELVAMA